MPVIGLTLAQASSHLYSLQVRVLAQLLDQAFSEVADFEGEMAVGLVQDVDGPGLGFVGLEQGDQPSALQMVGDLIGGDARHAPAVHRSPDGGGVAGQDQASPRPLATGGHEAVVGEVVGGARVPQHAR